MASDRKFKAVSLNMGKPVAPQQVAAKMMAKKPMMPVADFSNSNLATVLGKRKKKKPVMA